jgi:ParB family chromosome partitioning protein
MAADNRRGLGRGLSALLEETHSGPGADVADVRQIPIEMLHRNASQPRIAFPEAALDELAASIREKGVLQPILVRPLNNKAYEIVAGERRWRAAQKAGLTVMPALVRPLDDRETLEIAIIENVQRADLNPMEEATAYRTLMQHGRSQEEVAEVVGKSRPHVANMTRLLTLPQPVQQLVFAGKLSAGHARALIGARNPEALAHRIVDEGLSVRAAEALARKEVSPSDRASRGGRPARGKSADTIALERDLSEHLGLQVEVIDRDGIGEVRIGYRTLEQLDEICRRLTKN